jgi:hypothetical protein
MDETTTSIAEQSPRHEMTSTEVLAAVQLLETNGIEVYVDGGWSR